MAKNSPEHLISNNTNITAKILNKDVYKWNANEKCIYTVEFVNRFGKMKMDRKRIFIGIEKLEVKGKTYETAKFKGEYEIEAIDRKEKYNYYQFSYYAKNLGMIKSERYSPEGVKRILKLEKIITEEEFELLRKKASH